MFFAPDGAAANLTAVHFREILLRSQALDAAVLSQAERLAAQTKTALVQVLVHHDVIDGGRLARLLSRVLQLEIIDVGAIDVHPRLLQVIPRYAAERLRVLPVGAKKTPLGERLYLAMSDPTDTETIAVIEKATGRIIEPLVCDDDVLSRAFDRHYGPLVIEAPLLVGQVVAAHSELVGTDFLTESTAEALRFMQPKTQVSDEPPAAKQRRPTSVALAAALAETTTDNKHSSEAQTISEVNGSWPEPQEPAPLHRGLYAAAGTAETPAASLADLQDEVLFDETDVEAVPMARPREGRIMLVLPPGLTPTERETLTGELTSLLGSIDISVDALAACRAAMGAVALVLLEPRQQSALLRSLLDLEEAPRRPKIIVLGGDPGLRMLAFVDQHADLPDGPRAVALAVTIALRQAGVRP